MFTHHYQHHEDGYGAPTNGNYDTFVKWLRGKYLIAKYGLVVQKALMEHLELRDDAAGLSTLEDEAGEEGSR